MLGRFYTKAPIEGAALEANAIKLPPPGGRALALSAARGPGEDDRKAVPVTLDCVFGAVREGVSNRIDLNRRDAEDTSERKA